MFFDNETVETPYEAAGFAARFGEGHGTRIGHTLPPPSPHPHLPLTIPSPLLHPQSPHLLGTTSELAMLYSGGSSRGSLEASKLAQSEATFRIDAALSPVSQSQSISFHSAVSAAAVQLVAQPGMSDRHTVSTLHDTLHTIHKCKQAMCTMYDILPGLGPCHTVSQ